MYGFEMTHNFHNLSLENIRPMPDVHNLFGPNPKNPENLGF